MLGNHYDCLGQLPPLRVADVFAGGGSMGIEALSRGAAHCTFFERDRTALSVLRKNLDSFNITESGTIISRNAWEDVSTLTGDISPGLILLDPPYNDARDVSPKGCVHKLLTSLGSTVRPGSILVLHHPKKVSYSEIEVNYWRIIDQRKLGNNGLTVFIHETAS